LALAHVPALAATDAPEDAVDSPIKPLTPPLRLALVLALGVIGTAPAWGQRTSFDPRIALLWRYTDNVNIVEADGGQTQVSDSWGTADVYLPLSRETRFGSWEINYTGAYYRYNNNTQYDNLAHTASFNLRFGLGRGGTLTTTGYYTLSQEQGVPRTIEDDDQFLAVRTEQTFYGLQLRFEKNVRRWFWDAGLRARWSDFSAIEGTLPDAPPDDPEVVSLIPEGRTRLIGYFEFRRSLTRQFSLGARYDVARTELNRSGNELYQVLSLSTGWRTKRYFSIDGTVGFFERTNEVDRALGVEEVKETGLAWTMQLRVDPPLAAIQKGKIKVGLDVGIAPSGGGSLQGTSTDSYVRVYLETGRQTRSPWYWSIGTRYTRRESTLDEIPTYQTAGLEGGVEYAIGGIVSIRFGAGWSRQLDAEQDQTAASFTSAGAGLVIYPKGRRR
jgi:hypothetical protein